MVSSEGTQKPWQQNAWVQWLAIAIGVLPYTIASLFPIQRDQTIDLKVMLGSIAIWSGIIIVILLVLRFLCGERFRDLNQRAGTWWKDIHVVGELLCFQIISPSWCFLEKVLDFCGILFYTIVKYFLL